MSQNFQRQKKDTLLKSDKSFKGCWDKKIAGLCDKINSLENYYTTSSCSGRILIMRDEEKKGKGLFLKVWHDLISLNQLKRELSRLLTRIDIKSVNKKTSLKVDEQFVNSSKKLRANVNERGNLIKFKQEPCILHIACKDLDSAEKFLKKGHLAGWKKLGIITTRKRFVIELNSTEKLEFPLMKNGKILVTDEFFKIVVKKSNFNMKKSWKKIENLKKLLK